MDTPFKPASSGSDPESGMPELSMEALLVEGEEKQTTDSETSSATRGKMLQAILSNTLHVFPQDDINEVGIEAFRRERATETRISRAFFNDQFNKTRKFRGRILSFVKRGLKQSEGSTSVDIQEQWDAKSYDRALKIPEASIEEKNIPNAVPYDSDELLPFFRNFGKK